MNTDMRRQFQRALAGLGAPPGGGGGGGGAPMIMTIPPRSPIMIGPPGPEAPPAAGFLGTLKLIVAPTFRLCARDSASPITCTTLAKAGSGRLPSAPGPLRFRPRIR